MNNALYEGRVRHRRIIPVVNQFSYRIYMAYLDLAELNEVFTRRWFWSTAGFNLRWFRRADHVGDPTRPLDDTIRDLVEEETGSRPRGPIRLLTHLRNFGQIMNPVCFYYCWDITDTKVDTIVAEVRNTPWREIHCYVLRSPEGNAVSGMRFRFPKQFHVSPFMSMDQEYVWQCSEPGAQVVVHMENFESGSKVFEANMVLRRMPLTGANLAGSILCFPLPTLKVLTAIYWQAAKLWAKGCPYHRHPGKSVRPEHDPQ